MTPRTYNAIRRPAPSDRDDHLGKFELRALAISTLGKLVRVRGGNWVGRSVDHDVRGGKYLDRRLMGEPAANDDVVGSLVDRRMLERRPVPGLGRYRWPNLPTLYGLAQFEKHRRASLAACERGDGAAKLGDRYRATVIVPPGSDDHKPAFGYLIAGYVVGFAMIGPFQRPADAVAVPLEYVELDDGLRCWVRIAEG